jgi:hypothetical protein
MESEMKTMFSMPEHPGAGLQEAIQAIPLTESKNTG